jgi:2-keto-4-pentenoate hydratase/2-oxohepta-3-ene-1,7-dioic acid hydratase in catechol pathway
MKFIRFGAAGQEKPGLVDAQGRIRDLSALIKDISFRHISMDTLEMLKTLDPNKLPLAPEDVRIGPCVGDVGNFIAIGLNYALHATETDAEIPTEPILFNKAASCIVGPNDDVVMPPGSTHTDWEVELAIVMGRRAFNVTEANAFDYVAGLCVCNDVSERSYQLDRGGQWVKGKCFPTFGPLGPWLVTLDEIADPQNLNLWMEVNGERIQEDNTRTMIFPLRHLISYLSKTVALMPGDVITTGTPPGVGLGFKPPRYLKAGDVMRLEVQGLGQQQQRVLASV